MKIDAVGLKNRINMLTIDKPMKANLISVVDTCKAISVRFPTSNNTHFSFVY